MGVCAARRLRHGHLRGAVEVAPPRLQRTPGVSMEVSMKLGWKKRPPAKNEIFFAWLVENKGDPTKATKRKGGIVKHTGNESHWDNRLMPKRCITPCYIEVSMKVNGYSYMCNSSSKTPLPLNGGVAFHGLPVAYYMSYKCWPFHGGQSKELFLAWFDPCHIMFTPGHLGHRLEKLLRCPMLEK